MKNLTILEAVHVIERHKAHLYDNQDKFFAHHNVDDVMKITDIEFNGTYLTVSYHSLNDTMRKMQVPLFDYVAWRKHLG